MKFFGSSNGGSQSPSRPMTLAEIQEKLDTALTAIFNEDGKRTMLYYLSHKFDLTLEQASADPARFEKALTSLLGQVGWMVVKKAILEELWERRIPMAEMKVVEGASLWDAFGFARGFGSLLRFTQIPR